MSQTRTRRTRLVATMALLALITTAIATAAGAQGTTETEDLDLILNVGEGSRSLTVTDLLGNPFVDPVDVTGGSAAYKASVLDLDYLINEGFTLTAEQNNLYEVTGTGPLAVDTADGSNRIPSGEVSVSLTGGIDVNQVLADLIPQYLLSLTVDEAGCLTALGALPLDLTILPLADINMVCSAVGDASGTVTALPIVGPIVADVNLTDLLDGLLNLAALPATTPFTNPSFLGLGSTDSGAPGTPTLASLMLANPSGALQADIDALLAQLTTLVPAAATITENQIVTGLVTSGETTAASLGQELAGLTADALDDVVGALFALVPADLSALGLDQLLENLVGTYVAIPTLQANVPDGTPEGAYAGTHTVTLISG